jgi:hypothetical protein
MTVKAKKAFVVIRCLIYAGVINVILSIGGLSSEVTSPIVMAFALAAMLLMMRRAERSPA